MTKTELRALKCLRYRLGRPSDGKMNFDCGEPETTMINERTQLWRDTWIFPALDALIAKAEGKPYDGNAIRNAAQDSYNFEI